jgi:hypothetical protein
VILFIAFLLVVSLSAGGVENLSPQRLKISASRAFGWMGLSNVIAEQLRSTFPSTSTGEQRENMSQLFLFLEVIQIRWTSPNHPLCPAISSVNVADGLVRFEHAAFDLT